MSTARTSGSSPKRLLFVANSCLEKTGHRRVAQLIQHTGAKPVASRHRLLTTIAWKIGELTEYALEGSVFIGGAVVQWLRDGLGLIRCSAEIEALASKPVLAGYYKEAASLAVGLLRGESSSKDFI